MQCSFPAQHNGFIHPCGKCMACRSNQRRLWTHRIVLESMCHEHNSFVTLTYDDEHLLSMSLQPRDLTLFLKRLRKILPFKIRYFAVGEYGDESTRPHFHLAIFGLGFEHKVFVEKAWDKGFVLIGTLNFKSASYVGGYVTKKLEKQHDSRLDGRIPEFNRMSNRPGIGALAMDRLLDVLTSPSGKYLLADGDVPRALKHGGYYYPLGRYLRSYLRKEYGFSEEALERIKRIPQQKLQALSEIYLNSSEDEKAMKFSGRSYLEVVGLDRKPNQEIVLKQRLNLRKRKL